jgi:3-hydroxyphenylacetate 6-hydroxylase
MAIVNVLHLIQTGTVEHPLEALAISIILVPVIYVVANEFVRDRARIPGIKGPRGFPLIGNLWQIRTNAAEQYRKWARKYGGVYQIQLGNIPVVVVNTAAAAKTIFGQNAQALSSRPEFYTFHKVKYNPCTIVFRVCLCFCRCSLIPLEQQLARHHIASLLRNAERGRPQR